MVNKSGIHPTGSTVLVLLDEVPKTHGGTIELAQMTIEKDQLAQIRATLIECGPLSWENSKGAVPIGSRVIIRKYAGELVTGSDGVKYRVINDKDIYATFDVGTIPTV